MTALKKTFDIYSQADTVIFTKSDLILSSEERLLWISEYLNEIETKGLRGLN